MTYLDQFVDSVGFLSEIDPENASPQSQAEIHDVLTSLWASRDENYYQEAAAYLRLSAESYLAPLTARMVASKCHAYSTGYRDWFNKEMDLEQGRSPLSITVGNVSYRGADLYRHDRPHIKSLIERGPELNAPMDAHVWLTLDNMLVIDLTLSATMQERFGLDTQRKLPKVLLWRADWESDFVYEPLLVDNRFMYRVDRIVGT